MVPPEDRGRSIIDLLIRNGFVVDGAGNPGFYADVAVKNGKIAAIGRLPQLRGKREIDAAGKIVAPGFIDMHTHSDLMLLAEPLHEGKVSQGVTTDVIGHDGLSYAPVTPEALQTLRSLLEGLNGNPDLDYTWRSVREYLDRFEGKVATNVAFLVPHAAVRISVMGMRDSVPTAEEMRKMQDLVRIAMEEGGVGFSTALTYPPCSFATQWELTELCRAAAPYGGCFAPHLRSYGAGFLEAVQEGIAIAEDAGLPLHLTHFQVSFEPNRGKAREFLELIDAKRSQGMDITMDCYPYTAGSTFLAGLMPSWLHVGGVEQALQRLQDASSRARLREDLEKGCDGMHGVPVDWSKVTISALAKPGKEELVGQTLQQAAQAAGMDPFDFCFDLLMDQDLRVGCILENGDERNIQEVVKHPASMPGSDGILVGDRPHPRAFGTHARWLAHYVRELGLLSLEDCIRKMTSLPAQRLGLFDRGLIRTGMAADLVVFDLASVQDRATYENPRSLATGIDYTIVNGQVVWEQGRPSGLTPGRVLRACR